MNRVVFSLILSAMGYTLPAQDTFSIVAADSANREVGSAGASCVDLFQIGFTDPSFLGDLLPDTGAINTQAAYIAANQNNARSRMRAGDTPSQLITWLTTNDVGTNPASRQYGIVGFSGNSLTAAAHTGANCLSYKNHITGSINGIYYSIQGNILLGQLVLDSMESRFKNAQGDLACRLMAALQGAKMVGADTRCATNNTSSLFAFVKVAQPTDTYGNPSFIVTVRTHNNDSIEPVDTLQTIFDLQHSCSLISITENNSPKTLKAFPNPAANELVISTESACEGSGYTLINGTGLVIHSGTIHGPKTTLNLEGLPKGIYLVRFRNGSYVKFIKE